MRKMLLPTLAAATLLAGCSSSTKPPVVKLSTTAGTTASATPSPSPTLTIQMFGDVILFGPASVSPHGDSGDPCTEVGSAYADIVTGAPVIVTSPTGTVLGAGTLKPGLAAYEEQGETRPDCRFDFDISNIPAGAAAYDVTVSHRPAVPFSQEQVEANQVHVIIGQ